MEWGIISKENFKDIYEVPIKRWDPLSTISITTDEFGLHKKLKRYYGHYSYVSPIRGKRPRGYEAIQEACKNPEASNEKIKNYSDVFTAIIEGKPITDSNGTQIGDGYSMIITEDESKRDNPFSDAPQKGNRIPDTTQALTLINRYPSMARIVDLEILAFIQDRLPSHLKLATGINLLTISRDFYPSTNFRLIPEKILERIFLSMKEAILYCILESIERDYYDIPVNPFFNIGTKVGGSQPRIHSQTYIDLNGDGHGTRLELFLKAFKDMGDDCRLCETSHGDSDRIIIASKFWTFYTTGSPVRNYHIRFHPNEHIRRFTHLKSNQIKDLAKTLRQIFLALDNLGIDSNRNILFNGCPYGYDADFHMFGDIIPHEIIGGAEMADDMRVARKLPHLAALEIRKSLEEVL